MKGPSANRNLSTKKYIMKIGPSGSRIIRCHTQKKKRIQTNFITAFVESRLKKIFRPKKIQWIKQDIYKEPVF